MPRTDISETTIALAGKIDDLDATFVAADAVNGMRFKPLANQLLFVKNGSGVPITATVNMPADRVGRTGNKTVSPAAGKTGAMGPFAPEFKQTSGADAGFVTVDFSADTSVTVGLIEVRE